MTDKWHGSHWIHPEMTPKDPKPWPAAERFAHVPMAGATFPALPIDREDERVVDEMFQKATGGRRKARMGTQEQPDCPECERWRALAAESIVSDYVCVKCGKRHERKRESMSEETVCNCDPIKTEDLAEFERFHEHTETLSHHEGCASGLHRELRITRTAERAKPPSPEAEGASDEERHSLGKLLFESIPWNTCDYPAGQWKDAGNWERGAWQECAEKIRDDGFRAGLAARKVAPLLDPGDSDRLEELRAAIDDHLGWADGESEERGDYVARVKEVAAFMRSLKAYMRAAIPAATKSNSQARVEGSKSYRERVNDRTRGLRVTGSEFVHAKLESLIDVLDEERKAGG